jgi:hypothetical protein
MSAARGRLIQLLDSLPVDGDPHCIGVTTASPGYEDRIHLFGPVIDAPSFHPTGGLLAVW